MKLTAEQIRERAKTIAYSDRFDTAVFEEIIKLIEDDRGEKLPEPFDESKVTKWSVWCIETYTAVILNPDTGLHLSKSGLVDTFGDRDRAGLLAVLKENGYRYIGQYDFKAGLPNSK